MVQVHTLRQSRGGLTIPRAISGVVDIVLALPFTASVATLSFIILSLEWSNVIPVGKPTVVSTPSLYPDMSCQILMVLFTVSTDRITRVSRPEFVWHRRNHWLQRACVLPSYPSCRTPIAEYYLWTPQHTAFNTAAAIHGLSPRRRSAGPALQGIISIVRAE
ncbi:hypothetical protein EDB83DRAFT_2421884 [Lactarius deliciosus]|nr:hypothetical protein EDB83DRAFT_2421884 [Lactarius deliciosus]